MQHKGRSGVDDASFIAVQQGGNCLGNLMPQPHVLFVEDEELIRMIVSETLAEGGLAVTEAANGEEAVSLLDGQRRFDLVLTDVHMPGRFNGVDVARRARTLWPTVPVVFVTGRPDTLDAFGPPVPQDRTVLKPYKPSDVLTVVQVSLDRSARAATAGPGA